MTERSNQSDLDLSTVREILDAYFTARDLDEAIDAAGANCKSGDVYRFLQQSERARSYFDRLALADRGLREDVPSGTTAPIPEQPAEFERGFGDAVFDEVLDAALHGETVAGRDSTDESEREPRAESGPVVPFDGGRRRTAAVLAAAAVAALVAGTIVWGLDQSQPADETFQPRSAASPAQGSAPTPRLALFCAQRSGDDVAFRSARDTPGDLLECGRRDELKLAYENPTDEWTHAAFVGVDAEGDVYWYGPTPASTSPVRIETHNDGLAPFGETIRLEVNHGAGRTRVHAIFSSEPIGFERLRSIVDAQGASNLYETERIELEAIPATATSRVFRIAKEKSR